MSDRTTLSRAYRDGLAEEMERDPSILVMGTDLFERGGHWAQVTDLGSRFGRDRVRNTPISEAAASLRSLRARPAPGEVRSPGRSPAARLGCSSRC